MRRWRIVVAVVTVVLVSAGAMWWSRSDPAELPPGMVPARETAPNGERIRVQVLNGTKTRGLARRATVVLRDAGYDVVEVGTINAPRDTTLVLDLSGHPDWAKRIARTLAPARVEARQDSSRYLDIVVVLGSAWRPPANTFHP